MAQERKKNRQQQTEAQRLAHRDAVIEHSDNKWYYVKKKYQSN